MIPQEMKLVEIKTKIEADNAAEIKNLQGQKWVRIAGELSGAVEEQYQRDTVEKRFEIMVKAGRADDKGNYKMAKETNRRAIEEYVKVLGAEDPSMLSSTANLASIYRSRGSALVLELLWSDSALALLLYAEKLTVGTS